MMVKELAACRACGRTDDVSKGALLPEPDFGEDVAAAQSHRHRMLMMDPILHGWGWTCDSCLADWKAGTVNVSILRALLAVEETEAVAARVVGSLTRFNYGTDTFEGGIAAEAVGTYGKKPWAHVTQAQKDALNEAYAREKVKGLPATSNRGACGCCGVHSALGDWVDAPSSLRWPDGSPVAFCARCAGFWMKRGAHTYPEDIRKAAVEAATGKPVDMFGSAPDGFAIYCESRAADPEGMEEPWTYSDRLTEWRERVWTWNSHLAPPERRAEFEQKRADAIMRQRVESLAEQRRAKAATW